MLVGALVGLLAGDSVRAIGGVSAGTSVGMAVGMIKAVYVCTMVGVLAGDSVGTMVGVSVDAELVGVAVSGLVGVPVIAAVFVAAGAVVAVKAWRGDVAVATRGASVDWGCVTSNTNSTAGDSADSSVARMLCTFLMPLSAVGVRRIARAVEVGPEVATGFSKTPATIPSWSLLITRRVGVDDASSTGRSTGATISSSWRVDGWSVPSAFGM